MIVDRDMNVYVCANYVYSFFGTIETYLEI